MSDPNGPAGGFSLETEDRPTIVGPAPGGAPAPIEPIPPVTAPVEGGDDEPEGVVYDSKGEKLVPLRVLQQTRAEMKAAKALAAEVGTLRQMAERGQQVEGWVETVKPLLAKLKNRPDIVAAVMQDAPVAPAASPGGYPEQRDPGEAILAKHDAEDLARTLELYTPEGAPDLQRARKLALFMRKTGGEEAGRAMAPVTGALAAGQSGTLKGQYAQVRDRAGRTVNAAVLDQIWSIVPPELVAQDPKVAGVLYYAAKGYAAHHGLDEPAPAPRPPLMSEAPGGGRAPAPLLSEFDQAMRKAMQVTEKQYTESGSRYKPGAINVLE